MKRDKIFKFTVFSLIFCSILGVLLHFVYEWSGENIIVASFSAVNESVWEHLKLLFFPMLITTILGYFYIGKDVSNYFFARLVGILTAIIFVTVFFYTYVGIVGTDITVLDIGSFFVGILLGEYVSYKIMIDEKSWSEGISFIMIGILLLMFIIFTYYTPEINYFRDPVDGRFGIEKVEF